MTAVHTTHIMMPPQQGIGHIMCRVYMRGKPWPSMNGWMLTITAYVMHTLLGGCSPFGNGSWKAFPRGIGCQSLCSLIT